VISLSQNFGLSLKFPLSERVIQKVKSPTVCFCTQQWCIQQCQLHCQHFHG